MKFCQNESELSSSYCVLRSKRAYSSRGGGGEDHKALSPLEVFTPHWKKQWETKIRFIQCMTNKVKINIYCNISPIKHRHIRWIIILRYKNVLLIRHHEPSSSVFPLLRIATVKGWYFPLLFIQSPKFHAYLIRRYSLKCWPVCFTYKAPSLIRPVPYKWGITVGAQRKGF